jgi:crotonobetainyl-CoA:carnitine CoA-transferase CaiB-like acyl-CoA transferase
MVATMSATDCRPDLPAPHPRPAASPLPLSGIRVADFSHFIAGPLCTMTLGDMGAEVIKIEKPNGGDDFRRLQPGITQEEGAPFLWCNRNKKSIAIDLKSPCGVKVAHDIIAHSDILVENFATGVMARLGLDYQTVRRINPRLIYASISAYGRDGSLADRVGFDPIAQAESGFMSMNGEPDRDAVRAGPSIMDISTASFTTTAILGALVARDRYGEGQYIESALFDTAVNMLGFHAISYLATGRQPTRFGNNSRDSVPCNAFETEDGSVFLDCANDRTWHRYAAEVLERPDLAADPRYARTAERILNRESLMPVLQDIMKKRGSAHWLEKLRAAGVPAGRINAIGEAFNSTEMASREMVHAIPHPDAGMIPNLRLPFRMAGTPLADPVAAPMLGQHTDYVLRHVLRYGTAEIERLADSKAVVLRSA